MLTEAQKRELDSLVASMQAAGKTKQEIQAAVDSRKAEMLGENTVKEATKTEPTAPVEVAKPIAEEVIDESPIIPPEEFDISTLPETAPRATEEEIKAYEESVRLDKEAMFEGELRRIQEQRKLPEEMTATEKMAQSMENMYLRIQNIIPKVNLSSGVVYRKIFGDENVDKFVNLLQARII